MVQIVLIVIAITAFFKERLTITKGAELRRPNTYIFGGVTLATVVGMMLVNPMLEKDANLGFIVYSASVIIPLIAALVLKQPVVGSGEHEATKKHGSKK